MQLKKKSNNALFQLVFMRIQYMLKNYAITKTQTSVFDFQRILASCIVHPAYYIHTVQLNRLESLNSTVFLLLTADTLDICTFALIIQHAHPCGAILY